MTYTHTLNNVSKTDCYIRIQRIIYLPGESVNIRLAVFNTDADATAGRLAFETRDFEVRKDRNPVIWNNLFSTAALSVDGDNIVKNCYVYIKALAEFSSGTDVP